MNELIITLLLRLYAVVARIDGTSEKDRVLVQDFLRLYVGEGILAQYMKLFDQYSHDTAPIPDIIISVCESINAGLDLRQKYLTISHLVELVNDDFNISEQEDTALRLVCEKIRLEEDVYDRLKHLISVKAYSAISDPDTYYISSTEAQTEPNHLFRENMEGVLACMYMPRVGFFIMRKFGGRQPMSLNGQPIKTGKLFPFTRGSVIKGERIRNVYYSELKQRLLNAKNENPLIFEANNIEHRFKGNKIALHELSIQEEGGRLVAIMGASGGGKSTLLNVLNGTYKPYKGIVKINGSDLHAGHKSTRGLIGYVPQDDLLLEDLTVFENLFYSASLCLKGKSKEELETMVLETLQNLDIAEIKDKKVGSVLDKVISGGQRKRLNIALELIRQPEILFADEPTSGLSSKDSENVMDLLREQTYDGRLVFVVIHQPSSEVFKQFDKLILLDKNGHLIYYGNPLEAVSYFEEKAGYPVKNAGECNTCGNVNPEQIFDIVETRILDEFGKPTSKRRISPKKWYDWFKTSYKPAVYNQKRDLIKPWSGNASAWRQFLIFLTRDALNKLRNSQFLTITLVQSPALALLLALVNRYNQFSTPGNHNHYLFMENPNVPVYQYMSVIVALFTGLIISAEQIYKDEKIKKREKFLHLNEHSYLLAKISVLFVISAIQTVQYVSIGNWIIGIKDMNWLYFIVLFSASASANLLGLNISASFKSIITIYILIPILLIPQLILGGLVVKFDEINPAIGNREFKTPILSDLMVSRWAFESIAVEQFKSNLYQKHFYSIEKQRSEADFQIVYRIPLLQDKLNEAAKTPLSSDDEAFLNHELKILFSRFFNDEQWKPKVQNLQASAADRKDLNAMLSTIYNHYTVKLQQLNKKSDSLNQAALTCMPNAMSVSQAKETYTNLRLSKLVKNANSNEGAMVLAKGNIVQLSDPIFQTPKPKSQLDYRTQLYFPTKHFAGYYTPTFWFNLIVVWIMTFLLYWTLYFRVFRWLLNRIGNLPLVTILFTVRWKKQDINHEK
jgi:ABC-type multidrug transport system ATPase subunit